MVKRYEPDTEYAKDRAWMTEHHCGEWVSLECYSALAERCERLEAALRGLHREVEALVEDETLPHEAINHPSMIAAREALGSGT